MAREERQPMSDARLAEIRAQLQMLMSGIAELGSERDSSLLMLHSGLDDVERLPVGSTLDVTRIYAANIRDLLADVERLRAREAALVEVVRAVAFDDPIQLDSGNCVCYYCCACAPYESAVVHSEHCAYEQARALLASDSADEAK